MIKSKFAIGSVYLTVLFLIGFLALGVFFLAHPNMPMHNKFGTTTGAWLPGLVIMGGGGLLLYILLKKMVLVRIYMDRLELRSLFFRQTIYKQDIDAIDLTARADMGVLGGNRVGNATIINYGETEKYILLDFLYRNVPELKQALQENFLSSPGTAPIFPEYAGGRAPLPSGEEDVAERFAGNALLSVNGVLTDFASKAFSAGSLRKDTWKDLGKRLEEDGIPVKNEL